MIKKLKHLYYQRLRKLQDVSYSGDFSTWDEAQKLCEGYDSDAIFQKVKYAAMQVKEGKALFDRDSVLFYREEWNYPLIAWLQRIATKHRQKLVIVDLGGGIGKHLFSKQRFFERKHSADSMDCSRTRAFCGIWKEKSGRFGIDI